jgi:hypothetical protein
MIAEYKLKNLAADLAEISKFKSKPFVHPDIEAFYLSNLGYGYDKFIPASSAYRDFYHAIWSLLDFLDRQEDTVLCIESRYRLPFLEPAANSQYSDTDKKQLIRTTLREHTLAFADKMIQLCIDSDYSWQRDNDYSLNFRIFQGGMAALACYIGLGLSEEYYNCFDDQSQAGLAILEKLPEVSILSPYILEGIKETIRLFHTYMHSSMDFPRCRLLEQNPKDDLFPNHRAVKMLINAEMAAKRQKIFKYADSKKALSHGSDTEEKVAANAAEIKKQAESERQQLNIDLEEKFNRSELIGLRNMKALKAENKLQNKIIQAQDSGDDSSAQLLKEQLQRLKKGIPEESALPS